jgi:peptide/nickel transport system permease protein
MSGRAGYLASKVGWAIVTIAIVLTFNFLLFRVLPGDPAKAGTHDSRLNPESIAALRERFGLDKEVFLDLDGGNPFDTQYFAYLGALARGDFGDSYVYREREVIDLLGQAMVNSLWLIIPSQVLSIVLGVLLGLIAAWRRRTAVDVGALSFSLFMWSLPTFFLGILLLFVGANWFGLPTSGRQTIGLDYTSFWIAAGDIASHLLLPTLTLTLVFLGEYMLIMRSSVLEVFS